MYIDNFVLPSFIREPATNISFVGPAGDRRSVQSKLSDIVSLADFGGTTAGDNTSALNSALAAAASTIAVPNGVFTTNSLGSTQLNGKFFSGPGVIQTADGNRRGRIFRSINAAPSSVSPLGSIETAFNGDMKGQAVEWRVIGASTMPVPDAAGYNFQRELAPYFTSMYTDAGSNGTPVTAAGRTGLYINHGDVFHAGHGDAGVYTGGVYVATAGTAFTDAPAGVIINGPVILGANNTFANNGEFLLQDNGFDGSGLGWNVNTVRNNGTGANGNWWGAYRSQSQGSAPIDAAFSATGNTKIGLDLSKMLPTASNAFVCIPTGGRIYLRSTNTDPIGFDRPSYTVPGPTWFAEEFGFLNFVHNNVSTIQASSGGVTFPVPITMTPAASANPVVNGQVIFEFTSNTSLKIKGKGTDGTVRSVTLTLA